MSLTFISSSSNTRTGGTSLTLTKPATVQQNDLLVVILGYRSGGATVSAPSGWVLIRRDANGGAQGQAALYKIAGASEPASYTFTLSNSTNITGGLLVVRNANITSPINVHAASILTADNTTATAPSVTTTKDNCGLIVAFSAKKGDSSYSTPAGMTEAWDVFTTGTGGSVCAADYEILGLAGSSGTRTSTSFTNHEDIAQTIAITAATVQVGSSSVLTLSTASLTPHVTNEFKQKTITSLATSTAGTKIIKFFTPNTINAAANTSSLDVIVNNEDSMITTSFADSSIDSTEVIKISSLNNLYCEAIILNINSLVDNRADINCTAESSASLDAEINNVFQPGSTAACDSVVTINALVNGIGSANTFGVSESLLTALVNNEMEAVASANVVISLQAVVNNEEEITAIECFALSEAVAEVNNVMQATEILSSANIESVEGFLIKTVTPNPIIGIGETALLTGSTRLPSQSGIGITVEPLNANVNVNIIRIL